MALGHHFQATLVAARAGAEWAHAALYRDLHPKLLRYLRVQEPQEAEDLAADTWVDIARGLDRFDGDEAAFYCWTFTIARRRLLDARRKDGRRRTAAVPAESLAARSGSDDTERDALRNVSVRAAVARIAALPPDQAEVILLRVLGGLDVDQVAELMSKRPGTIRVLQHRALKRLAQQLASELVTQ
jgi:RNA polymerase sigma-70 factor (ECF subfamily)